MSEYILWFGLVQNKGKGSKDNIMQDRSGRKIYMQQHYLEAILYLKSKQKNAFQYFLLLNH